MNYVCEAILGPQSEEINELKAIFATEWFGQELIDITYDQTLELGINKLGIRCWSIRATGNILD